MNETERSITKNFVAAVAVAVFLIFLFFVLPAYLGLEEQPRQPAGAPMESAGPGGAPGGPPGAPPQ